MIRKILLLGEVDLYKRSDEVAPGEEIQEMIHDLHDTLMDFKERYRMGRAIAAPQIGVRKRIIYLFIDSPMIFLNPVLSFPDEECMEVLDDCMSFPNLLVKVKRYRRCQVKYFDENWMERKILLEGDLAELLQHEYDHLDGILATMRAVDNQSFFMKKGKI